MLSWRVWVTTCLAAVLTGVCVGTAYVAVNSRFDAPQASGGTLPGVTEQAPVEAPAVRLASAVSGAHKAKSSEAAAKSRAGKPAKAAKAKAAKAEPAKAEPAKAEPAKEPKASGGGDKPAKKGK